MFHENNFEEKSESKRESKLSSEHVRANSRIKLPQIAQKKPEMAQFSDQIIKHWPSNDQQSRLQRSTSQLKDY